MFAFNLIFPPGHFASYSHVNFSGVDWQISTAYIPIVLEAGEAIAAVVAFDWDRFLPLLMVALAPFDLARKAVVAALDRYDSG